METRPQNRRKDAIAYFLFAIAAIGGTYTATQAYDYFYGDTPSEKRAKQIKASSESKPSASKSSSSSSGGSLPRHYMNDQDDYYDEDADDVYYENCTEARRAGAAPIEYGEPGYRDHALSRRQTLNRYATQAPLTRSNFLKVNCNVESETISNNS